MGVVDAMAVRVVTAKPDETVHDAVRRMLDAQVGSVAVCDGSRLAGIFTERDVMRLAGESADFTRLRVGDVMTTKLFVVGPDDDVVSAARLMQEKKIRHLPVVQDGNLLGILGIREVLRTLVERLWSNHDADARETARDLLRRGA
jgi:CBS domain-containing protein